ncbi:Pyoverdine/dityrosine biosynthesis protein-domain-containing protein [Annulohypoxylon maeteangense]|uniref:Pyoverdine/dityrosine biosynthesis protein-domain-containing protein n=1 Tax=Annulohypoxylon maeteangense TaxID=1927788 RepID=UPI0020081E69|nr:Pyoverdine/dityrosine biosynthesis protein-domain-containing protein [Annulohypoxylon maeteangense]KAI0886328.1 Pyoverdine/dityrosine biosynthesis protein-domain-containing protein [Annulohypoxylon maeteangense]
MPSVLNLDFADGLAFPTALAEGLGKLEPSHLKTASRILNIISRYKLTKDAFLSKSNDGINFLSQIYSKVSANETVLMCLPAFPFKSPNTTSKVLGRLPDKAEEFALAHLNGLCAAIGDIYVPGARLMIVSDGLVYNDLLGVPDKDVWAYGEALRTLRTKKNFHHIEFCRLRDIVQIDVPNELDEIRYVANATNFRYALLKQFSKPGFNVSLRISEDEDTCLTYRGYIKFLATDLQNVYPVGEGRSKSKYKKGIEYIAKQMLMRGDAFARAVREMFPDRLRLSIHASTGENKLSVNLLPTDTMFTTPWHCSIAFRLDGTTTTGHRSEFEVDDTFELVYEDGRPSYFREKSDLLSWATEKGGITCEPLYPAGFLIRPATGPGALSIHDVDAAKVRELSQVNSPVVLRGFSQTRNRDFFVDKSREFGTPLPWKFGLVLEVKDRGMDTRGLNNVLSAEWMPFHYDGLFKTEKRVRDDGSEELVSTPPLFQFFTAVTESPKNTGFTLFSSSTLLFKYLPSHLPLSSLRPLTWDVSTSSFGSTTLHGLPLVIDHPATSRPCLRFHEPWPQSKTRFDATHITIDNASAHCVDSTNVCDTLTSLLHDRRVAYYHSWEKGDLLVSDNVLAMHTRSDFTAGCERELWRIHFD